MKTLTLFDISYKIQFSNILNSKLKNYNINNINFNSKSLLQKTISNQNKLDSIVLTTPKTNSQTYLLLNLFLIEKNFIFSKNTFFKKTTHVLSRVPNYKMNLNSPVSADRYRGNIHKRLSILNLNRLSNQKISSFLINLNSFAYLDFFKKNSKLNNAQVSKTKNILKNINNVTFYLKSKIYAIFIRNALKKKIS